MQQPSAIPSGTFAIGGDLTVHRLGFGAMRITGGGIWGDPADPTEARRVLARLPDLGVDLIDNLARRDSEDVVAYCEAHDIGFIPWFPLAAGSLARPGALLDRIAPRLGATHGQVALAWLLRRSPVMLPIPGTGRVEHLEENVAASALRLGDDDVVTLGEAGAAAWDEANRR